ncbi:MAG: FliA/WhiG family RNA polymerase sigma factor [Caldilineaceae bacterium]|nr:FliA/WhiG family RNA polymerase sigma factor [Caldilineaceae bacterium]
MVKPEEPIAEVLQGEQEEILTLWRVYKETLAADLHEKLVLHYAPLVNKVVGGMGLNPEGPIEWGDLINYGILGLIDAINRFEPERGFTFQTYSSMRIRGAVLDALRQLDPLGRQARRRVREARDVIQRLTRVPGCIPDDEEVAAEMDLTLEQYQTVLLDASFVLLSLDQPMQGGEDEKLRLADLLEDPQAMDTLAEVEKAELYERLAKAIRSLPCRDQILLSLYYYEELTMREVATAMDISQTRVCQLHARIILTLKAMIAEKTTKSKEAAKIEPEDADTPEITSIHGLRSRRVRDPVKGPVTDRPRAHRIVNY